MLKHLISVNDLKHRYNLPIAPSAVDAYVRGKGTRIIPDALVRCLREMIDERQDTA